jgi:hypothetical protein
MEILGNLLNLPQFPAQEKPCERYPSPQAAIGRTTDACAANELWERSPTAIIGVTDASHESLAAQESIDDAVKNIDASFANY